MSDQWVISILQIFATEPNKTSKFSSKLLSSLKLVKIREIRKIYSKQYSIKVPKSKNPKLESLYTSKSIEILKGLRKQIENAQIQQEKN